MPPHGKKKKRPRGCINKIKTAGQALVGKKNARAINNRAHNAITGESFARGGRVRKTGLAKVHAGECVLTKHQATALKKILR